MDDALKLWALPVLAKRFSFSAYLARGDQVTEDREELVDPTEIRDGLAVIPIQGLLAKEISLARLFGWSDQPTTGELTLSVRKAAANPAVHTILLLIDSLGGLWPGLIELCDEIWAARQIKPVIAYVEDHACSAAYCVASQAAEIVCNRSAMLGSLGVFAVLIDTSKRDAEQGIKVIVISTAELKGAEFRSDVTDALKEDTRRELSDTNEVFLQTITRGREWSDEDLAPLTDGRVHIGHKAMALGLADRVLPLRDYLSELMAKPTGSATPKTSEKEDDEMSLVRKILGGKLAATAESPTPASPESPAEPLNAPSIPDSELAAVQERALASLEEGIRRTARLSVRSRLQGLGPRVTPAMRRAGLEEVLVSLQADELAEPTELVVDGQATNRLEVIYQCLAELTPFEAVDAGEIAASDDAAARATTTLSPELLAQFGLDAQACSAAATKYGMHAGEKEDEV